jgi:peptidyl-prolyl cis-trans isomerase A (cyclophilin A)
MSSHEQIVPEGTGPLTATLDTSLGTIVLKLYEKEAPRTVANFVGLATGQKEWRHPKTGQKQIGKPLYDGTTFHRVIPNFMIQAGDPLSHPTEGDPALAGRGDPGYRFADEFQSGLRFDRPGLLAMANSGPNSNGSQWFITEVATPHLNNKHTIFGEVLQGFELIPRMARVPSTGSRPDVPIVIRSITISRGPA